MRGLRVGSAFGIPFEREAHTVADVMISGRITVAVDAPLTDVLAVMRDAGVGRVVVLDGEALAGRIPGRT